MDFKNPTVQKVSIGIVLAVVIIALWYYQWYQPNNIEINSLESRLESLRLELADAKSKAMNVDIIIAERDSLFLRYRLLERLMPRDRDEPKFLQSLNNSAANNGILVSSISPRPTREVEFFYENPYDLVLTTDFHKLGFFLSEIANFKFTTTASQMNLSATGTRRNSLNINLSLSTYHITDSLPTPKELKY